MHPRKTARTTEKLESSWPRRPGFGLGACLERMARNVFVLRENSSRHPLEAGGLHRKTMNTPKYARHLLYLEQIQSEGDAKVMPPSKSTGPCLRCNSNQRNLLCGDSFSNFLQVLHDPTRFTFWKINELSSELFGCFCQRHNSKRTQLRWTITAHTCFFHQK